MGGQNGKMGSSGLLKMGCQTPMPAMHIDRLAEVQAAGEGSQYTMCKQAVKLA